MSAWPMYNQSVRAALLCLVGLTSIEGAEKTPTPAPSLPGPPYPEIAQEKGWQGTTVVSVRFTNSGELESCRIIHSSGHELLDQNTITFIQQNWHNAKLAGRTLQLPIIYKLQPGQKVAGNLGGTTLEQLLTRQGFIPVKLHTGDRNTNEIEVNIDRARLFLVVDTGAATTVLSEAGAAATGAKVAAGPAVASMSVTGEVEGGARRLGVQSFKIEGHELTPSAVYTARITVPNCEGLLGLPTMKANHMVISINPAVLLFNPHAVSSVNLDGFLQSKGFTAVQLHETSEGYVVPVQFDGISTQMILDTGASITTLSDGFLDQSGYHEKALSMDVGGVDGGREALGYASFKKVMIGSFSLGPRQLSTGSPVMFSGKGFKSLVGLLGFDCLAGELAIIDTSTDRLYLRAY